MNVTNCDRAVIGWQLGREPRAVVGVAARCQCGEPCVVVTSPRLADGTPFPTLYYITCPRLASAIGSLEGSGLMRDMESRLRDDHELRSNYQKAHERYLTERANHGKVPEIAGISAGGMPTRVKCLHVLAGQALASGSGINVLGDEVVAALDGWWQESNCHERIADEDSG